MPLLGEVIRTVNAVNRIAQTDATRRCAANLRGAMESFRKIASQRRRKYAKRRAEAAAGGEPQGQEGRDGASAGV